MSDLNSKFDGVRTQLAEQHADVITAINALLTALGAPPPSPGATLVDVVGALNQIAVQLAGLRLDMSSQHAAQLAELTQANTNLDLMLQNNSLNAQRLIAAIVASSCCTTEAPPLPLPLISSPTTLEDQAKCRRIQFFLTWFGNWLENLSTLGGLGASLTGAALTTLIATSIPAGAVVGGEVGAVAGPPGVVVGAIIGLFVTAFYTLGSAAFGTLITQWRTAPLYDQLLAALYNADSAAEGDAAFRQVIGDSQVLSTIWKGVINALWWNGWSNDIYSDVPVVDDSGFDGTICAPAEIFPPVSGCIVLDSVAGITRSDNVVSQFIVWPSGGTNALPSTVRPAGFDTITASDSIWYVGNLQGYYLRSSVSMTVYINPSGDNRTIHLDANTYQQVTSSTSYVEAGFWDAFTLEICASLPS